MNKIFITGTDTAVGKTVVSLALLQLAKQQGLGCVGFKPVAQNAQLTEQGLRNSDALLLQKASTIDIDYEILNPYAFEGSEVSTGSVTPVSDHRLSECLDLLSSQAERVVVEGTGGWHSRINNQHPLSDWVVNEKIPVVLVVGIKLGCINHAILTAESIVQQGLTLVGWVANRINPGLEEYQQLITLLGQHIAAPMLGEIPYLPQVHRKDLTAYLDIDKLVEFCSLEKTGL